MNNFFKNLSFVVVLLFIFAAAFVFLERQFFIRYFTHTGDLLALPVSWSKPVDIVTGMQRDNLSVVKDADLTIPRDILNDVSAYAERTGSQSLIVMHKGGVQIEKYWGGAERGAIISSAAPGHEGRAQGGRRGALGEPSLLSQECDEDSDCEHTEYCTNKVCTIPNPGND